MNTTLCVRASKRRSREWRVAACLGDVGSLKFETLPAHISRRHLNGLYRWDGRVWPGSWFAHHSVRNDVCLEGVIVIGR